MDYDIDRPHRFTLDLRMGGSIYSQQFQGTPRDVVRATSELAGVLSEGAPRVWIWIPEYSNGDALSAVAEVIARQGELAADTRVLMAEARFHAALAAASAEHDFHSLVVRGQDPACVVDRGEYYGFRSARGASLDALRDALVEVLSGRVDEIYIQREDPLEVEGLRGLVEALEDSADHLRRYGRDASAVSHSLALLAVASRATDRNMPSRPTP